MVPCPPIPLLPSSCMQLVMSGRTVVAAVKSTNRAKEVFGAMSLQEGVQQVRGFGARQCWSQGPI